MGAVCTSKANNKGRETTNTSKANILSDGETAENKNIEIQKQTLSICCNGDPINKDGTDRGLLKFFENYLNTEHVNDIFGKYNMESIENIDDLIQILALCILIYKIKAFQIKNAGEGENKTRIQKKEFKPIAEYLSFWIVHKYGNGKSEIEISRANFRKKMKVYMKRFVSEHLTLLREI